MKTVDVPNINCMESEFYYGQDTSEYNYASIEDAGPWKIDGDALDLIERIRHIYGDVMITLYKDKGLEHVGNR